MSKIENHIIDNKSSQQQNSQSNQSYPQQKRHTKNKQNTITLQNTLHKHSDCNQNQNQNQTKKNIPIYRQSMERLQLRFSRFKPWNLIESVENIKVDRESQENIATEQKNLQQSDQLMSQYDYQIGTPIRLDNNFYLDQHSNNRHQSSKKQTLINMINSTADKKLRPKQKGLRKLSQKAFNIVKQIGQTTYKQVAIKLIQEIQQEQPELNQQKQQNNIKRRVYDALNVLIAMNFLKKKGRNIVYEPNSDIVLQQSLYLQHKEKKNQKIREIITKVDHLKKKKQQIRYIRMKIEAARALLNRNKNQSNTHPQQSRIQFPFVCLVLKTEKIEKMQLSNDRNKFSLPISTQNQYSFLGDIDFLLKHPKLA